MYRFRVLGLLASEFGAAIPIFRNSRDVSRMRLGSRVYVRYPLSTSYSEWHDVDSFSVLNPHLASHVSRGTTEIWSYPRDTKAKS